MGKAGRWLRSFFVTGRKGWIKSKDDRDKQHGDYDDSRSVSSTPAAREKRRWSFRRSAAAVAGKVEAPGGLGPLAPSSSSSSQCFSVPEVRPVVVQGQHAVVTVPNASDDSEIPTTGAYGGGDEVAAAAAIKIQSAFRSYLARKARCALRGMVKLQAMVRGQLVRRQASVTLRRMQALVDAQMRARAERMRLLIVEDDDDNGGGRRLTAASSEPGRRRSSNKAEQLYRQKKALTDDANARSTVSGRSDDDAPLTASAASSEPGRRGNNNQAPFPNYMAITESSRAKARRRSQSAPRQRLLVLAAPPEHGASPSPSRGGMGGSRDARCSRASLDLLGASRARRSPAASAGSSA